MVVARTSLSMNFKIYPPEVKPPTDDRLCDAVDIVPTPGHTLSHHSLGFEYEGRSVMIAGDAVATRDFWRERWGYYNCVDFALSARSMDKIPAWLTSWCPGHDNFFFNPTNPL
jgi:glyoxylase-like metal-dependent hydrolase (beta-lactamase superfamily II)